MAKPLSEKLKQQWKNRVNEQRSSGLSVPLWCRQNAIPVYNFRYWQHKLFPNSPIDRSTFTEIPLESTLKTEIILAYQGFNVHLSQNFDPITLKRCLEPVQNLLNRQSLGIRFA